MEERKLKHVAFIMDGNGRWAKAHGLPRYLGHKAGAERVRDIYEECCAQGIEAMSLYAFSTENWNRPKEEIKHLFQYLEYFFKTETKRMIKDGVRVIVSGDISRLPPSVQDAINKTMEVSKDFRNFTINIFINYGGRDEIVRAAKLFAQDVQDGKTDIEELNEENFVNYLYTKDLPPVDLMVRTSGELRISNYLLYQLAYAEFAFPSVPWPDFTKEEFRKVIEEFYSRDRRYGGIKDE